MATNVHLSILHTNSKDDGRMRHIRHALTTKIVSDNIHYTSWKHNDDLFPELMTNEQWIDLYE